MRSKRKIGEMNECTDLDKAYKKPKLMIKLDAQSYEKKFDVFNNIKECFKQFHKSISVGPMFVCTCCHQKSVSKKCLHVEEHQFVNKK